MTPDVIIAGGGVIGLVTAHALAREGARVTLVDEGRPAATAAAAGMLAPSFERALSAGEALETSMIHSLAGLLRSRARDRGGERPQRRSSGDRRSVGRFRR